MNKHVTVHGGSSKTDYGKYIGQKLNNNLAAEGGSTNQVTHFELFVNLHFEYRIFFLILYLIRCSSVATCQHILERYRYVKAGDIPKLQDLNHCMHFSRHFQHFWVGAKSNRLFFRPDAHSHFGRRTKSQTSSAEAYQVD